MLQETKSSATELVKLRLFVSTEAQNRKLNAGSRKDLLCIEMFVAVCSLISRMPYTKEMGGKMFSFRQQTSE